MPTLVVSATPLSEFRPDRSMTSKNSRNFLEERCPKGFCRFRAKKFHFLPKTKVVLDPNFCLPGPILSLPLGVNCWDLQVKNTKFPTIFRIKIVLGCQ